MRDENSLSHAESPLCKGDSGDDVRDGDIFNRIRLDGNLVDTLLVAAALELGGEVLVHDLAGHVLVNETAGHYQHVGVVVLTDEVGNLGNPAQTGTNVAVVVERHVDALAAATDGYAGEHLALLNTAGQRMAEIAVVARVLRVRAIVLVLVSLLFEILLHKLLQCKTSVIAGDAYCLYFHCS